jgi:hypothetical protein
MYAPFSLFFMLFLLHASHVVFLKSWRELAFFIS